MLCILCHSDFVILTESINKDLLNNLYKRAFNIDVCHILTKDICYYHCNECDLRFFALENDEIPIGDNAFYNALNTLEWYYMEEKNEYDVAKDYIGHNSKVLEVGCGKAAFSHYLPSDARYVGLEFSTQAKEMALSRGVEIKNMSIEEFALTNKGFDVACSFQVLEHVANPYSFLSAQIACLEDSDNGGGRHKKYLIVSCS